jgi:DNA-binding NarL/FixJ family response regulator
MPIRVLLADDSDSLRSVIERHLKSEPTIELVAQAKEFQEAVRLVDELSPDVVVLDLRMTSRVDVNDEGVRQICRCWTIAMSASIDDETKTLAGRLNADIFIDKMHLYEKLIPAILELAGRPS